MKKCLFLGLIHICAFGWSQNLAYESIDVAFYRTPLKPMNGSPKTYSAMLYELGDFLGKAQKDTLLYRSLIIPGLQRVEANGDVQLELVISPFTVTKKEVRDQPLETEKDGKKSVLHQYWYVLNYTFPMKLRVLLRGRLVSEQDLPGVFNTEYYPEDRRSEAALKRLYDQDYHFRDKLLGERLYENKHFIRRMLSSEYGYGMFTEGLEVGYVKDRKGVYPDLTKAMSLMNEALKAASNRKDYLDDSFTGKMNEAISIYSKALEESSDDKKARIDPKVSTLIHYDIALAFYGLQKYDEAQSWLAKATSGEGPAKGRSEYLENRIADKVRRLNAKEISVDDSSPIENTNPALMDGSGGTPEDFIILKSGDSVKVKFLMPSSEIMPYGDSVWLQDKIIVWNNDKRIEATARELVGYSYKGVYRHAIRSMEDGASVPPVMNYRFCKMIESGAIGLYDCYEVKPSFRDASRLVVITQPWYTKGEDTFRAMFLSFNRGVSKLVEDYPELAEKVRSGAYERDDFYKVIREYNQWAAAQKK